MSVSTPWFKTSQGFRRDRNNVEFLERHFITKSFRLSTKAKLNMKQNWTPWSIFIQRMILYSPVISSPAFSPLEISMQDSFFPEITLNSLKSQKNPTTICSVDKFWCQSFLKPFQTIGDKTLGGREEFISTYPHPERTYGRTVTTWSIFSHRYGLRSRALSASARRLRYKPLEKNNECLIGRFSV